MEMFWTLGIILLPLIAWLIIPLKIDFRITAIGFTFHSWNLFVAICALPSIFIAIWLFFFPESPKFLIEIGDTEEALDVLKQIFHINTGRPCSEYPIKSLKAKEREKGENHNPQSLRSLSIRKPKELKILLNEVFEQSKALCRAPHLKNTLLTCAIQFFLTASYYSLMIWFPELFYRFEEYEHENPSADVSVCDVSSIVLKDRSSKGFCGDEIRAEVYWHTVILGLSCIPTSLILPICIHRLGAKFFLGMLASPTQLCTYSMT
jgi:MFS transporter, VNT family, synaptic vesicle glycoprotein 2